MPDIFGFVVWSIGICRKKKTKTSSNALRQLYNVMAGRKNCLTNLYLSGYCGGKYFVSVFCCLKTSFSIVFSVCRYDHKYALESSWFKVK